MNMAIRSSRDDDIPKIAAIYRHHVLYGIASFEDIPPDEDEVASRRRDILALKLPYLVAEQSGQVVGYSYASRYRERSAYRFTLEDSIYVDAAEVGRGIGRALLSTPRRTLLRTRLSPDDCRNWRQRPVAIDPAARDAGFYANRPFARRRL
jgi:L-amino acid N-acyltransferase YncA